MNNTSIQTTIAPIVAFLAGLLASKGVLDFDIATWTTVLGSLGGAAAAVWAAFATRKQALVNEVAAMPEKKAEMITAVANMPQVKNITLDSTVAGTPVLNNATPVNVKPDGPEMNKV